MVRRWDCVDWTRSQKVLYLFRWSFIYSEYPLSIQNIFYLFRRSFIYSEYPLSIQTTLYRFRRSFIYSDYIDSEDPLSIQTILYRFRRSFIYSDYPLSIQKILYLFKLSFISLYGSLGIHFKENRYIPKEITLVWRYFTSVLIGKYMYIKGKLNDLSRIKFCHLISAYI